MNGRGGCCIARYAAGGSGGAYTDANRMERVMLKFRPIAPKPVSTGSGSVFGSSSSDNSNNNNNKTTSGETTTYVKAARGKRKYNTTAATTTTKRRYNGGGRKRVRLTTSQSLDEKRDESSGVTTLSLLPESPSTAGVKTPTSRSAPVWLNFTNNNSPVADNTNNKNYFSNGKARAGRVVGSGVTVERVTDTWVSGEGLGRTDEEKFKNLEYDTCPGFITEGYENKVKWINQAYKKMVFGDQEVLEEGDEVMIWVVMKERLLMSNCMAFTCSVKVQNTCTKEIKVLPCDVWRMDGGGFAWRLDVKAALSLGR